MSGLILIIFWTLTDLQPNIRGWLLGTTDGKSPGYLPSNYVKILGLKRGQRQSPPAKQDPHLGNQAAAEEEVS